MSQYSFLEYLEAPGRSRPRDFQLVPWDEDFLSALLDQALEDCGNDLSRAVFIFPHARPGRYMVNLLQRHPGVKRPLLVPQFHTVNGLFSMLARNISGTAFWDAGLLDRIGLLLDCVRQEVVDAKLFQALPGMAREASPLDDARLFFPWGVRLSDLFEECLNQGRTVGDFQYMEGEVVPFAARLLERLSAIFSRYQSGLQSRQWTTAGRNAALVADHLAGHGTLPGLGTSGNMFYIAGFHTLTGTEETLFKHIWNSLGGRVFLHGDPGILENRGHWSCEALSRLAHRWKAGIVPHREHAGADRESGPTRPIIRYYQAYDLHSQLKILQDEPLNLPGTSDPGQSGLSGRSAETGIVLPDTGLLMPVLHHLPPADVNISMGYPLSRSPLFRLIDTLLRLQENRREEGYYWRDLIELVRHPYLKMLEPVAVLEGPEGIEETERTGAEGASLRVVFGDYEQALRSSGSNYPDPFALLEKVQAAQEKGPGRSLGTDLPGRIFSIALDGFCGLRSPGDMGRALEGLCSLLLAHGRELWERFPIDAECLHRLMQSVIPELSHSALAREEFSPATLFTLTRQLLDAERVPFEATPLVGLQVLGVLESRLLTFRKVILLDATEDHLPGGGAGDPLLPESLRPELGLPGRHSREQITAYHFFRLLAGAEEAVILWQDSADTPGIQDAKKKKSRFVEELLWEEEKRAGRLLADKGRDGPLEILATNIQPLPRAQEGIPVTDAVAARIRDILAQPLSASFLDAYMTCPLRFFHERVLRLSPAEEVAEGEDPLSLGRLLHQTLQDFFLPLLNQDLPAGEQMEPARLERLHQALMETHSAQPGYHELKHSLRADSFTMLRVATRNRFRQLLLNQPATRPLALETRLAAHAHLDGRDFSLVGFADRIDIRFPFMEDQQEPRPSVFGSKRLHILDYKTGTPQAPAMSLWEDAQFWQRVAAWSPEEGLDQGRELLFELADRLRSVQLPFYLFLYSLCREQGSLPPVLKNLPSDYSLEAAWIPLGGDGKEAPLFHAGMGPQDQAAILESKVPDLVGFVLRHLSSAPVFSPRSGRHCDWCFRSKFCNVNSYV